MRDAALLGARLLLGGCLGIHASQAEAADGPSAVDA